MEPGAALMHRLEEAAPDWPRSVRHCSPGSQSQCEDMGLGRARFDLAQAVNEARSGGTFFGPRRRMRHWLVGVNRRIG